MNFSLKNALPLAFGITLLGGNVIANSAESEDFFSKKALARTEIIRTAFQSEKYTLNLNQSLLEFANAKVQCQKILKKMACLEALDRAFTSLAKTQYSMTRKSMFQASIGVNIHESMGVIPFKKAIEAEGVTKFLPTHVNEDLNQLFQLYSTLEEIIEQATTIDRVLESTGYRYNYGKTNDNVEKPFELTPALSGSNDYFTNRTLAENFLKRVDVVAPQVEIMVQLLSTFRTVSTRSSVK